jgi:hypothetical protein
MSDRVREHFKSTDLQCIRCYFITSRYSPTPSIFIGLLRAEQIFLLKIEVAWHLVKSSLEIWRLNGFLAGNGLKNGSRTKIKEFGEDKAIF